MSTQYIETLTPEESRLLFAAVCAAVDREPTYAPMKALRSKLLDHIGEDIMLGIVPQAREALIAIQGAIPADVDPKFDDFEPEPEEPDMGDAIDDEGGMSEYRFIMNEF